MSTPPQSPEAQETPEAPRHRVCGTMPVHYQLLLAEPGYASARARIENATFSMAVAEEEPRTEVVTIPVVVHVVHRTTAENISREQVESQIEVLNQDFRARNGDLSSVPEVWGELVGDARIEFRLADLDPAGDPTDGIVRRRTSKPSFGGDDEVKSAATGGSDAWPTDRYLNLWACTLADGLLGYAQFPGGPPATDGVVILNTAFGTVGTAAPPFDLGRTATHEIGHWLNLRHIWGDDGDGCSGDDFVPDTPNQAGPNAGVPGFPHVSCANGPEGDLYVNYMDYTDDRGMVMFTRGQIQRMDACLAHGRPSFLPVTQVEPEPAP